MKRSVALYAGLVLAASTALAGCTTGTVNPAPSGGSTSTAPETSAPDDFSSISVYYPVALGNSWTYRISNPDPVGVITEIETMTKVTPEGDGVRVEMTREFHYENGAIPDFTDAVEYIFHSDGSITVPFQSSPDAGGAQVTVTSGEMVWPSTAEFEAATPKTGELAVSVAAAGQTIDQVVKFSVVGGGTEEVTAPAGTFSARRLSQQLLVSIASAGIADLEINSVTWLAEGVGPVRTESTGILGSGDSVVELLEFRPAS